MTLRGSVPLWASVALSNSLMMAGVLSIYLGLRRFIGEQTRLAFIAVLALFFAVFVAVHTYYCVVQDNLTARTFNFNIGFIIIASLGIWLLVKNKDAKTRLISSGVVISAAVVIVILLFRTAGLILNSQVSNNFLQFGKLDTLAVILFAGGVGYFGISMVLMVNRRLYLDSQDMENLARKNAQQLQAMFKSTSVGIGIISGNRIKEVNAAFCEMLGYGREEICGQDLNIIFQSGAEYQAAAQAFLKTAEIGSYSTELRFLRKNGTMINVIANAAVFEDNSIAQSEILSIVDITPRKQAEEALKLSEQNFRNSLDTSVLGIRIEDKTGKNLYANQAVLDIFGYGSLEELVKNPPRESCATASGGGLADAPLVPEKCEISVLRNNGGIRNLEVTRKEVLWNGQQQFQSIYYDITERKQTEYEKLRLREKAQVSSRLAAMGEMAAGIAHEINNPLTGILGYSQMVMERENIPEGVKEDLKIVAENSLRVAEIVKRMLTFARQSKPTKVLVNLNDIIENTLKLREYVLKTADIRVVTSLDTGLPQTVVDPGQIQQVFLNLIVNAEQAMKAAHGKGILYITTKKNGNDIRVSFQDDGTGISPENLSHIFEPFFTTKAAGEGTGLGLSLSRSIVLEHGGAIHVDTVFGSGATFIIDLPIVDNLAAVVPSPVIPKEQKSIQSRKGRILVVDDEVGVRNFIERVLTKAGHTVDSNGDAADAVRLLDAGKDYDLIISDFRMPEMNGIDLYKFILQKRPEMKNRVMFITGDVMGSDIRTFLVQNNLPHLVKPFSIDALTQQINQMLNG
jgi:PAS domain S-box-containing protein